MLPKLAELWEARKILYFVATNHINYFDSAIIRSHRFDALILVSPPSFGAKIKTLKKLLSEVHGLADVDFQIKESEIQEKLEQIEKNLKEQLQALHKPESSSSNSESEEAWTARWREQKLEAALVLAKFVLLRHDELNELAYRLASQLKETSSAQKIVTIRVLGQALDQVADTEWRKNKSYLDYVRDTRSERRDYQMLNVWEVSTNEKSVPGLVERPNGLKWLPKAVDGPQYIEIPGFQLKFGHPGRVEIVRATSK
jgi:SpoVK/Ycf46/Vps4 family AAA+-type ATPase